MDQKQLIILPCSGIGKSLGTITRWTAFEIVENLRKEDTRLLCLARLVVADEESKKIISTHRTITIDGCPKKCASKNIERNGGTVLKSYMIAKFIPKNKDLQINAKDVINPGKDGEELAKRFAKYISEEIDELQNQVQEGSS